MADQFALLDADVWTRVILGRRDSDPQIATWRRLLVGRQPVIAAQTEAELRFLPRANRWSTDSTERFIAHLEQTPTAPVTPAVIIAWAELRATCRTRGHALADKARQDAVWVAATAVAHGLPLLSGDQVFRRVPELRLLEAEERPIGPQSRTVG